VVFFSEDIQMKKLVVTLTIILAGFPPCGVPTTTVVAKPALAKHYVAYENPIEPNAPGYTLPLDLTDIENYTAMDSKFDLNSVAPLLEQSGFAIIEHDFHVPDSNGDDIVKPYEYLDRMDVPLFVTADTLLHLYHIQFDETLKDVEEREFYGDIGGLTAARRMMHWPLMKNIRATCKKQPGAMWPILLWRKS